MLGLVVASIIAHFQRAGEIFVGDGFWFFRQRTDDHLDSVLREQALGTLTHAAGDNDVSSLLAQPTRQYARFVSGRGKKFRRGYSLGSLVNFHNGELLAMAKVHAKFSSCGRYRYFHFHCLLWLVDWLIS